jgi:hypothetical protein
MNNSGRPLRISSKSPVSYNKNENAEIIDDNEHVWPINTEMTRKLTPLGNRHNNLFMEPYNLRWANEFAKQGSINTRKRNVFNRLLQKKQPVNNNNSSPVEFKHNVQYNFPTFNSSINVNKPVRSLTRTAPKKFNALRSNNNAATRKRKYNNITNSEKSRRRRRRV